MQFFMLLLGVVSGATQGIGSVKNWTPVKRNSIIYVFFWSVVSGATQGDRSLKT